VGCLTQGSLTIEIEEEVKFDGHEKWVSSTNLTYKSSRTKSLFMAVKLNFFNFNCQTNMSKTFLELNHSQN